MTARTARIDGPTDLLDARLRMATTRPATLDAGAPDPGGPEALPPAAGVVIGVIGARGGAGAGVLAAALARCSAALDRRTLLVDADPLGTGLAWTFAGTMPPGLSAPTLRAAHGRLPPGSLRAALPRLDGVHLLSRSPWSPELPEESVPAVLDCARRDFEVLVVDLPRHPDPVAEILSTALDVGLLVVPAEPAAMRAAGPLTRRLSAQIGDLRLVVRGPEPRDLPWQEIEQVLQLPVQARLTPEPGLDRALARGEPPGLRHRSPLTATARGILAQLLEQFGGRSPDRARGHRGRDRRG